MLMIKYLSCHKKAFPRQCRVTKAFPTGRCNEMGKFCQVCNKGLMNGNRVSHAENKTGRMYAPNVQRVRVLVDGRHTHLNVCTRCLRSGKVIRALPNMGASAEA